MDTVSRRDFLGMGAAMGAAAAMGASVAMAAPQEVAPLVVPVSEDSADMYRFHTSVDTINEIRRQIIDECEDFVCEDGTVIPAIWVKCRMLLDGLGAGIGAKNYSGPECFELFKWITYGDEELAQFYVNCPVGRDFTVLDAAIANDCTEQEAADQCKRLAWTGAFFHSRRGGLDFYHHQRHYHGITESSINLYKDGDKDSGFLSKDFAPSLAGSELVPFPCYYPMPVGIEVMAEESGILPYDDIEALLDRHEIFAVTACQCRYISNLMGDTIDELPNPTDLESVKDFVCADGNHLEKCFTFGEEAEFYIEQGIGRQISREEARELIHRQIDEGCIMQSCYTKYTEVICSCDHGCTNMPGYIATGVDGPNYANQSHYLLEVDKDVCIGCGLCASRCMANAVEIIDGKAEVTGYCFRCGQCGLVCPVGARKLANKDPELIPDLPEDLMDWINKDTMYRYEKGLWPYPMAGASSGGAASLVPDSEK